jgi:GDP-4-dehydro-6-deoxy-D-mannose reductase
MDIIIARPFNHPGPKEHLGLVCSDFAKQIADIEKGNREPVIKVGNLENKRDFTDVRDIVKGYVLLAERGRRGEIYNLCSGKAYSIKSVLDKLVSMSTFKINIKVDMQRIRAREVKVQIGDDSKIFSEVGWKPQIPLNKTLEDILTYYRNIYCDPLGVGTLKV